MDNKSRFERGRQRWKDFVSGYVGPYDFSRSIYVGMNKKVVFQCPKHGGMHSDAKVLMNGGICQKCMFENRRGKSRVTQGEMLTRFVAIHGDVYGYDQAVYVSQQTPVQILCYEHGYFWQKPEFHWGGSGCPACFNVHRRGSSQRGSIDILRTQIDRVFGFKLRLLTEIYTNSQTPIEVTCEDHGGVLKTKANWLVNGANPCPKCNHTKSRQEEEIAKFLSVFTTVIHRDRTILSPRELDIYLPKENIAVEYCGMFWHSYGDKDSVRENKNRHYEKYISCATNGVRLITIYESEWQQNPTAIRRLLRNAIGKSKGKLMARKCEVDKVSSADARTFYDKYHPQGGDGYGEHYGLFWGGKLVACMRFTYGINDRGKKAKTREWTLSRYATRVTVSGAASRLFKAFISEHEPDLVKSFSDNRFFSGGMYQQLGFVLEEESKPDYSVWSMKLGLRPKSHYQRRLIPKRLKEHGVVDTFDPDTDPRSESDMTYLMGARRIYDCGKKKWIWTATNNQTKLFLDPNQSNCYN